ncbi:MAG: hypothetical protein M5T61_01945 [Acidimicrobiia bacterium]|nr:hypothetical protein [Acidimicrobiia bacterium]
MARISAAMVARSRGVAESRWSPGGTHLAWLDSFDGRTDVLVAPADGSGPAVVATADVAVTGAGVYGGGVFAWAGDDALVVAADDGRLLLLDAGGGPARVLSTGGRAFAPAVSPDSSQVAFCLERNDSCDIAVVRLDGSSWPVRVSEGADFSWDPCWSPDGRTVAWHEWDHPDMPWDSSRIVAREIGAAPEGPVRVVAGETASPPASPDSRPAVI